MTKERLRQYRSIKREIQELRAEAKENEVTDAVKGSDVHYPYTVRTYTICGDISKNLSKRSAMIKKMTDEAAEIEQWVYNIDDSITRRIFKYRYICGNRRDSWTRIAMIIGGGNTAESIRKIHDRYLQKNID